MTPAVPSRAAIAVVLLVASAAAAAHDTWFVPLRPAGGGSAVRAGGPAAAASPRPGAAPAAAPLLALGTGDRFPQQEFAFDPGYFVRSGCSAADGRTLALTPLRLVATAVWLRAGDAAAVSCWMQSQPFEVTVPPDKTAVYLDEINASPAIRAHWARIEAQGIAWNERYTKHARIHIAPGGRGDAAGLDLDLRVDGDDDRPLRAGDRATFRLFSRGLPMAGQPLELQDDSGGLGNWQQTDTDGRIAVMLPRPGRWLLRGTELLPSPDDPTRWVSRFVTLAFDVQP